MKSAQNFRKLPLLLLLAAFLSGCSSVPPTQYYLLSKLVPATPPGGKIAFTVGVPQFEAEGVYARDNLLFRRGSHEIEIDYYRRWGVPPQKMLAEVMIDYLRAGAVFADVLRLPTLSDVDLVLGGRILHLEQTTAENGGLIVLVELEFVLRRFRNNELLWRDTFSSSSPITVATSIDAIMTATENSVRACLEQAVGSLLASSSSISSALK